MAPHNLIQGNAQFFSLSDTEDKQRHSLTFQVGEASQELCNDSNGSIFTGDSPEEFEFFIIDALNGEVVSTKYSLISVFTIQRCACVV